MRMLRSPQTLPISYKWLLMLLINQYQEQACYSLEISLVAYSIFSISSHFSPFSRIPSKDLISSLLVFCLSPVNRMMTSEIDSPSFFKAFKRSSTVFDKETVTITITACFFNSTLCLLKINVPLHFWYIFSRLYI